MNRRRPTVLVVLGVLSGLLAVAGPPAGAAAPTRATAPAGAGTAAAEVPVAFAPLGRYATGGGEGTAEIAAVDRKHMYVLNSPKVDVVDISDPSNPRKVRELDVSRYGATANSVAARAGRIAVAVASDPKTEPGRVVIFSGLGRVRAVVRVGALPDMLTFTPDGSHIVVANEGEPSGYGPGHVDPPGSISLINVDRALRRLPNAVVTVGFAAFDAGRARHGELPDGVRLFGPGATVSQDLEPEYVAVTPDSKRAIVTLQENNAVAIVNLRLARVEKILALGTKDHDVDGNGLDASDRDDTINIAGWPVRGMYQPDAIATFGSRGRTYFVTANEGDARDWDGFAEEVRVGDDEFVLDSTAFPNFAELKEDEHLGRLTVTKATGDTDGDGDFDEINAFGARSISIWTVDGHRVWDSGDAIERTIATTNPANFNANSDDNDFDNRSDNKGPEPEGVAVGRVDGRTLAFAVLERQGGLMIWDVTDPTQPAFRQYVQTRDFTLDPPGPDSGPEAVSFVDPSKSPTGKPLVVVSNEISGTVTLYGPVDPDGAGRLTLLHNNDGETSLLPFQRTVSGVDLPVAGAAAFKTLTDQQIRDARSAGHAVVNLYAGDSFLASSTLACSLPPNPDDTPIYDAVAQRQIAYDAHIFGNHEFDFGPDFLEKYVRSFEVNGVLNQPFLSANLDFTGEPAWADLLADDGLVVGSSTDGKVVARAAVITDEMTGQRFGVVSATTWSLPTISSPRNVRVTSNDLASTAAIVQQEVDRLAAMGLKKIVFVSHLQDLNNDRDLVALVSGVDVAVGGGGDELLTNSTIPDDVELLPGETQVPFGEYPLMETGADGKPVYLVTTSGNYKYLGRLDVEFDADGNVVGFDQATSFPRRVIPTSDGATALGLTDAVTPDPGIVETVDEPLSECLAELAEPIVTTEVLLNVARGARDATTGAITPGVRISETNAGNLIADSFLASYDRYAAAFGLPGRDHTVLAVQNGGGIRQNAGDVLPVGGAVPGPITRQNTLDVMAFLTNSMTVVNDISPAELKEILERSAAALPGGGGQFLQVAGFSVIIDPSRQAQELAPVPPGQNYSSIVIPGERVVTVTLTDGTPVITNGAVDPAAPASFRIVTNSFTAAGGDNYPTFGNATDKVQLPATYEQALVEYLLAFPVGASGLPTVPASDPRYRPGGEGRITVLGPLAGRLGTA